jgi:hypothetical protein
MYSPPPVIQVALEVVFAGHENVGLLYYALGYN